MLEQLLLDIGTSIKLGVIMYAFYLSSKIYKNIVDAHKRHIYNTVNYNDCIIEKDEKYGR